MRRMAENTIHGINAVREALNAGVPLNRIHVAREARSPALAEITARAKELGVPVDVAPMAKLNAIAGVRDHQGVVAKLSPADYASLDECIARCGRRALLLVLDQVQHPKNLGMLVRTAAGAGASGVIVAARGGALLDDSVVRASAGLVMRMPIVRVNNLSQAVRELKDAGFWAYGLDVNSQTNALDVDWPDRCAIIVGNESEGLRIGISKNCDALLRIPMASGVDSLNVSVAAGVVLFQAAARLGLVE